MKRLERGMRAETVDGYFVGTVGLVRACCFAVRMDGGDALHLSPEAIFNVVEGRVTLIFMPGEHDRYLCQTHGAEQAQGA